MFNPEKELLPISSNSQTETKETLIFPERIQNAEVVLRNFVKLNSKEKVLFLKDVKTNSETLVILKRAIAGVGCEYQEIFLSDQTKEEDLNKLAEQSEVIIDLSTIFENITEEIYDNLEKLNSRLVCLMDLDPEAFAEDGPMSESLEDLEYRLNKMEAVLKDAVGFKITSVYGTNLEVPLRPFKERRWFKDAGVIDKPGIWDNLPGGEIFTTPDEANVNGILVLPALDSTISKNQGVDEFIQIEIKNGLIVSILGGESAKKLKEQLEEKALEEHQKGGNPLNVYRIAEISWGANTKARSTVRDSDQPYNYPGVSVIEAEKRFGTMHLAFGSSKHGEEGTEGFGDVISHYDFVIPRNGLTAEMYTDEKDFEKKKNGRRVIDEGRFNFFNI